MEGRKGEAYRTNTDYAETQRATPVITPTHGRRGLERFRFGSTTERVVRRADVPVLTLSPDADAKITRYQNVLVPTDGSDCANEVLAIDVDVTDGEGAALQPLTHIEGHDIGLVAVGTHGRTGFDRYVLGSVTDYPVRTSPIPVLTVREPAVET